MVIEGLSELISCLSLMEAIKGTNRVAETRFILCKVVENFKRQCQDRRKTTPNGDQKKCGSLKSKLLQERL